MGAQQLVSLLICKITTICATAGSQRLILVKGSNLLRSDLTLMYRIIPTDFETLTKAVYVQPSRMEEWGINYLIEEKVPFLTLCDGLD